MALTAASQPSIEDLLMGGLPGIPKVRHQGISEAYVSPQIERTLGFTRDEWLRDPVRWYKQLHPDDKARWSIEAAQIFLTGN